ncbi:MAG: hypothetical protein WC683_04280 [bacterium]
MNRRTHLSAFAAMVFLSHAKAAEAFEDGAHVIDVAGYQRRPKAYGTHLSKAERRGKSYAELQDARERKGGER